MIIFPSSYFDITKVDEDLQKEADAVRATGLYEVAVWGYDMWLETGKLSMSGNTEGKHFAIYRGWMMSPEKFRDFYNQLKARNIQLVTDPYQYKLMHIFPNAYEYVKDDTAKMEIFKLHSHIDVGQLKQSFQRFMVKDYVKSVKGTEFPRFFDHSVTQEVFDQWMELFYKYRGNLLTGGICIKEFLELKHYGERTNEW